MERLHWLEGAPNERSQILGSSLSLRFALMKELSVEKLRVSIGDQEIVRGLSLHVPRGEVHALMGPNGSGKSTLAKVLAGHPDYQVTSGKVLMDGENLLELEPDERAPRGHAVASPRGRGAGGNRLLCKALRKNGVARNGSFVHLARGQ